jgi:hypothetical protein
MFFDQVTHLLPHPHMVNILLPLDEEEIDEAPLPPWRWRQVESDLMKFLHINIVDRILLFLPAHSPFLRDWEVVLAARVGARELRFSCSFFINHHQMI